MKKIKTLAIVSVITMTCTSAFAAEDAEPQDYFELGHVSLDARVSGTNLQNQAVHASFSPTAARITFGHNINDNFGAEFMVLSGLSNDGNVKVNPSYGAFLKSRAKFVGQPGEVYARVGFFHSAFSATGVGGGTFGDSDVAYGVGVKFGIAKDTYLTADYMNYMDKEAGTSGRLRATGLGIGVAKAY